MNPETSTIASALAAPMTRRTALRNLVAAGAAVAVMTPGLGLLAPAAARSTDSLIVNTSGARLRSAPGTGASVIASLARGTQVRYLADGGTVNGYRWYKVLVIATGKEGFMARDLLSVPDGSSAPVIIGTAKTTASVNLRSGPSTGNSVLRVVAPGSNVQVSNTVNNGFRYVVHNGLAGWIADQYLGTGSGQPGGETFTTTARVNLRAEPSTGAAVRLVIPSGATVKVLAGTANGWRQVSYNGTTGWAATSYLN